MQVGNGLFFLLNKKQVIKIPSSIFKEINDKKYLENTKYSYQKIKKVFPNHFIAKSNFYRKNGINIIEQEYIKGKDYLCLNHNTKKLMLKNMKIFFESALKMLEEKKWLPDFDIKRLKDGFTCRNIILEEKTSTPKIIDFTSYYDIYRLYPTRKNFEVQKKTKQIKDLINWIENKL